jgi:hypothetical protein
MAWRADGAPSAAGTGAADQLSSAAALAAEQGQGNSPFVPPPALPQTKVPVFPMRMGRDKVAPAPFQLPLMIPPKVGTGKAPIMLSFRMARPGEQPARDSTSDA